MLTLYTETSSLRTYAQKPQQNRAFMNSASEVYLRTIQFWRTESWRIQTLLARQEFFTIPYKSAIRGNFRISFGCLISFFWICGNHYIRICTSKMYHRWTIGWIWSWIYKVYLGSCVELYSLAETPATPYLGSCVELYSLAETPATPYLPPHLGSYTRALLVSLDRRHLFKNPCGGLGPNCKDDIVYCSHSLL